MKLKSHVSKRGNSHWFLLFKNATCHDHMAIHNYDEDPLISAAESADWSCYYGYRDMTLLRGRLKKESSHCESR